MYFFRYMTMFFLWASAVMLATYAAGTLDISTSLENAVQYIQQIVLTSDGSNLWTTGVFIDGAGKIGIGTDSPTTSFQIDGNSGSIYADIRPTTENPYIWFNNDRSLSWWIFISDWYEKSLIKSWGPLRLTTNPTIAPDLVIATWGNVGIGTYTPWSELEINWDFTLSHGTNRIIKVGGQTTTWNWDSLYVYWWDSFGLPLSAAKVWWSIFLQWGVPAWLHNQFDPEGNYYKWRGSIILNSSGWNVGIGTTSTPWAKLEVNGNIKFTNSWYLFTDGNEDQLYLWTNNNVGIGLDLPLSKLDVQWGIKALRVSSNPCWTTWYPEWTMFYTRSHVVPSYGFTVPDMYCFCDQNDKARPVNGSYYYHGSSFVESMDIDYCW